MSNIADYTSDVSLRLSQVLNEIGVNERIVMKQRRSVLWHESLGTLTQQLQQRYINMYFVGSQIEGTTTRGLNSDADYIWTICNYHTFQDWSEWKQGICNLLMIQNDTVSPGYCYLQMLRFDVPLPHYVENKYTYTDKTGRTLLKNTCIMEDLNTLNLPLVRHGPAQTLQGRYALDNDIVHALPCLTWPIQARQWLDRPNKGQWPTADMKEYCRVTGCFVVPVGNKNSANEELEWRISTSLAERCCMFNLNITQIRCYILMKMIIKTFISTHCPDSITSFMCKTVLLHCVSNTRTNFWKENSLLPCLTFCLSTLYHCVLNEYCPHYMIPENNLMYGRFPQDTKRFLLETISYVVKSNGHALLEIKSDQLGIRIQNSFLEGVEKCSEHLAAQISCLYFILQNSPVRSITKALMVYFYK
jgi:hypothetical protein